MLIGCVGKPSVGKSTFFKAATLAEVEIAPYPFTTIKPNEAIAYVKIKCVDKEFNVNCNPKEGYCIKGNRFVPVKLMDVAGLVPGSFEGKGMGNQFLDDLRQADVLLHVIDISGSTNEKGETIEKGNYDPANDIKFLEYELDMWYYGIIKKGWEKFARKIQQEKNDLAKALSNQLSGLNIKEEIIEEALKKSLLDKEKPLNWKEEELKKLASEIRKIRLPMIIVCNKIDISTGEKNFERLKKIFNDYLLIPCSAESELALKEATKKELIKYIPGEKNFEITEKGKKELNEKQKNALNYIKKNILEKYGSTGVQLALDKAVFDLLKYKAIFPGGVNKLADKEGNVLPDCFLLPKNATAIDFAYHLHTDIGNNFIKAIDVKTKKIIGKDYMLKHRDVIEIKTK